ncbi:MAG: HAMP domain-containing histidine kinase [Lachnospiraceae bacterium]|nr:HAMP domain-containing histidine kinase [Lachnospiraceae bacterium]
MTLGAFFYVDKRILRPAENMTELTRELAKGNLSRPLLQEKSGYLKSFLWSVDMLRETLEDNRRREMALEKEKRSLVLSLAHDIKTPLSALDLYTKALSDNLYEDEEKKNAALLGIAKNKEEIRSYVDRITAASREDFLNLEVRAQEAYISSVMDPVRKYYRDKLQLLSIPFTILLYEDALIRCDRDRLVEVLQNCMENAVKYGDGREITVSIRQEEECKLFTVKNTGCTLREDELDAVFDSFYRGSNAGNQPGSGLGLYICRQLLHKMDGEIYAEMEDGCFLVTLVLRKA